MDSFPFPSEAAHQLYEDQILREKQQRDIALGRRFNQVVVNGDLSPLVARYINTTIPPVAARIRLAAEAYLKRDYALFGSVLDTPLFGAVKAYQEGSPDFLEPILRWCLKGSSPGRLVSLDGEATTYAEDLVLATLGSVVLDLSRWSMTRSRATENTGNVHGVPLARVLSRSAICAREAALGQFITMVQGANAIEHVRRNGKSTWAQSQKLQAIAQTFMGQIKPALQAEQRGELQLEKMGSSTVLHIVDPRRGVAGRQVTVKNAQTIRDDDWALLATTVKPMGVEDPFKNAWITFSMMVLCAAQVEHGWFDITGDCLPRHRKSHQRRSPARYLILAESPRTQLRADFAKWAHMGFCNDPMVVPPEQGDYLTVKRRSVGRPGPKGLRTVGEGSTHWETACEVMAKTPWRVATETLQEIQRGGVLTEIAMKVCPDESARRMIMGAYAREADKDALWLPLFMDFRGRLYPRTSWVTYQGNDLQKGLLRFPNTERSTAEYPPEVQTALALHFGALFGADKKALPERRALVESLWDGPFENFGGDLEKPIQAWTACRLGHIGRHEEIPIQIDGTCNGLQHLSAMFRDEEAAPWVNLTASTYDEPPNDIYGRVAHLVTEELAKINEPWARRVTPYVDRKVCKRPVMVLPYGGTFVAIEEGAFEALIEKNLPAEKWQYCTDRDAIDGNYAAFKERPLKDHPLFKKDVQRLAEVILKAIKKTIPRAMEAMDAFREIAKGIGERSLEWSNGVGSSPLWIVHAYPKSERRTNIWRGFHLPNSVRGLALRCGKDEINPAMHRTGIVANFIHSNDAAHLVTTMDSFRLRGGKSFGANHDCLTTRASEMPLMNEAVRAAFRWRYEADPLKNPVRIRELGEQGRVTTFDSWYALAKDFGVELPGRGTWKPEEVLKSAWFFS